MLRTTLLVAAFAVAAPAIAQDTTPTAPQQSAINANNAAAAAVGARDAGVSAQYQADLAAYDAALARHDARADRQAEHYYHQQRAYADAMAAWRAQDYACHHGSTRACNAPTPDPAAFW